MKGEMDMASIIIITYHEPICTQLLMNHTVWRRRKRHIWHYNDMLFALKVLQKYNDIINGQIT